MNVKNKNLVKFIMWPAISYRLPELKACRLIGFPVPVSVYSTVYLVSAVV